MNQCGFGWGAKLQMAARQGLEPQLKVPKTSVLPLHHQATVYKYEKVLRKVKCLGSAFSQ